MLLFDLTILSSVLSTGLSFSTTAFLLFIGQFGKLFSVCFCFVLLLFCHRVWSERQLVVEVSVTEIMQVIVKSLRGDWPVKFWSQNVPEQVFVFFQVWVPKHAYFSSKSVFLWYMFDFYANENILWTIVCLFLSCGRSFHWKNTPFHPLVTGTFYPKLSTCCLSKCSVASDLQNDVMTQWELPLMKAQMVWKGGKGIPTETS